MHVKVLVFDGPTVTGDATRLERSLLSRAGIAASNLCPVFDSEAI